MRGLTARDGTATTAGQWSGGGEDGGLLGRRVGKVDYDRPMKPRVVVLGAGFGGLELATVLSEALGDDVDMTLIDKNDAFVFGYSKLDVMFGRTTPDAVRLAYRDIAKPGVRFLQQTIIAIDPEARRVTTDGGVHEADFLVVALGWIDRLSRGYMTGRLWLAGLLAGVAVPAIAFLV